MSSIKKVYTVDEGKVVSADVIKETKKLFFIDTRLAFGCAARLNKEYACVTPQEAVQEEINMSLEQVGNYGDRLRKAEERLKLAMSLRKEYGEVK